MAKILFTYEGEVATVSILKDMFRATDWKDYSFSFIRNAEITPGDIDRADTIVFIRPTSCLAYFLARKAKKAGCRICTFLDDDLLNYRPITPWRLNGLKGTLQVSEELISFSRYLLEKYAKEFPQLKTIHIDMIVNEIRRKEGEEGSVLKIVYAAGRDHAGLFEEYVSDALKQISEKYIGKLSITFVGCKPRFEANTDRIGIEYVQAMPLEAYRDYMREAGFDIGLAPLKDAEFSRCKYYNKFVEYSMYGICGIFSDVEPYRGVVTPGLGLMTENTTEAWSGAIEQMITQKDLRDRIRRGIYDYLQENNSRESFEKRMPEWFSAQKDKDTERTRCTGLFSGKILYELSRPLDKIWFFLSYARHGQLKR